MTAVAASLLQIYTEKTVFEVGKAYIGVPNEVYHSDKVIGLNRSKILKVAKNPKNMLRKEKTNKGMDFGDYLHKHINEPDVFAANYFAEPPRPIINAETGETLKLNTKEGIAWKKEVLLPFIEENKGKVVIDTFDWQAVMACEKELKASPEFANYQKGLKEVVIIAELTILGQKYIFKCKVDSINFDTFEVFDLKNAGVIETWALNKSKTNYFYDVQGWLYMQIVKAVFPTNKWQYKIIWAEHTHDNPEVRFEEIDEAILELGQEVFTQAMRIYTEMEFKKSMGEPIRRFKGWEQLGMPTYAFDVLSRF